MAKKIITLSLRPYPGIIKLCPNRKTFYQEHLKLFGEKGKDLTYNKGRMSGKYSDKDHFPTFLVWAENSATLAHEFSHVILHIFDDTGIDPREANGEPFCYLLSQLLTDSK